MDIMSGRQQSTTGGQKNFAQIPKAEIPRSVFNRSCGLKTTLDAGYLVPIFFDMACPGDTMNMQPTLFGRLATQIKPVMDNLYVDVHWWAVPVRQIWRNWERMHGAQTDPGDSIDYMTPVVTTPVGGYAQNSIYDYFGLPIDEDIEDVNALPFRAYNRIYDEWYRSETLQDSVDHAVDDGPDADTEFTLLRRGKRHDYFTSCTPWPQKGDSVTLPLGTSAPVTVDNVVTMGTLNFQSTGGPPIVNLVGGTAAPTWSTTPAAGNMNISNPSSWVLDGTADLSGATAATINEIRLAFQLQKILERDARGGTRYTELLKAHYGVTSPDARLQRPEYLGGGTSPVTVNPVAQTLGGGTLSGDLADLGGLATVTSNGKGFVKSFTEWNVVIGLVSLRADLNYQQGIPKEFLKRTRYDYYYPALAHIGEQAILSKEIFADGGPGDELVWGYQEAWADMRYKPSMVTGQMRSQATSSFDIWHLAQDFSPRPLLNDSFIQENPPVDRILAVPSEPHLLLDCFFDFKHARPLPTYSVPGMLDHF